MSSIIKLRNCMFCGIDDAAGCVDSFMGVIV